MNKLLLIGNGFDLAHGLPTSYKNFIDDIWKNIPLNHKKEGYQNLLFFNDDYLEILNFKKETENFKDFESNLIAYQNDNNQEIEPYKNHQLRTRKTVLIFKFNNIFFQQINSKNSIEKWVDIENEYYLQLKKITKLKFGNLEGDSLVKARKNLIIKLNEDFEQIKILLEEYLLKEVVEKFDFNTFENFKEYAEVTELLKPIIIAKGPYLKSQIQKISQEFSIQEDKQEIKNYETEIEKKSNFDVMKFKSLLLSFNYTPTISSYNFYINRNFSSDVCSNNYIHGELKSSKNKINFGFGDEIDVSYKEIENIGDNEYLKNFKSFQYSNTQNYDSLLRYIDSGKYQIYILGHSCGLSDRLLLNTIFEHPNCRSIKVFFYESGGDDNYTDIVQNISRHFEDKQSMRRKIVSKELSSPLPQNVRFKKK